MEEAELDFKPLEECEEGLEEEDCQPRETKEMETEANRQAERKGQRVGVLSVGENIVMKSNALRFCFV